MSYSERLSDSLKGLSLAYEMDTQTTLLVGVDLFEYIVNESRKDNNFYLAHQTVTTMVDEAPILRFCKLPIYSTSQLKPMEYMIVSERLHKGQL